MNICFITVYGLNECYVEFNATTEFQIATTLMFLTSQRTILTADI